MKLKLKDIIVLSLVAALMVASKFMMEFLPNIHLLGVLTVATTVVYRRYALLSIYVYVIIQGIVSGVSPWWVSYLYVWTLLWAAVMLIPQKLPQKVKYILYVSVCSLHGFLFGVLCAPVQAVMFGLDLKGTIAWIAAGLYFDIIHGVSNLILSTVLIYPIIKVLKFADKYAK